MYKTMRLTNFALISLAALGAVGCGSDLAFVSGTISYQGKPLDTGRITFQGSGLPMAYGEVDSSGRYTLNTGEKQGITPGTYNVAIASYEIGEITGRGNPPAAKLITPAKYANMDTTDLKAEVVPGNNRFDFELRDE
jgi:hypothetical protein